MVDVEKINRDDVSEAGLENGQEFTYLDVKMQFFDQVKMMQVWMKL